MRPKGTNVLHTKFVLRRKRKDDGYIEKYKVGLVVCSNKENNNDNDFCPPVVDYTVIKLLQSVAIQKRWKVKQFDFQNAFPNGNLDRAVYADLPKHLFTEAKRNLVVMKL